LRQNTLKNLKAARDVMLRNKEDRQSPNERMLSRFRGWLAQGIKVPGLDVFQEWYHQVYLKQTECEACLMPISGRWRVVDHHHATGCVRLICCHLCNAKLAVTDKQRTRIHDELMKRGDVSATITA
jgi:hypothetical protein